MTRQGFTLIEVLVAVLLTSLVMVLTYAVLASTLEAHASVRRAEQEGRQARALLDLVGVDLDGVMHGPSPQRMPADTSWLFEVDGQGLRAMEFPAACSLMSYSEPAELGRVRVRYEFSAVPDESSPQTVSRLAYAEGRVLPGRTVATAVGLFEAETLRGGVWTPLAAPTILDQAPAALRLVVLRPDDRRVLACRTFLVGGHGP